MIWGIIIGAVAVLAIIGFIVMRQEKKAAPAKLAEAEAAFARGDLQGALNSLKQAFLIEAGDKLGVADAQQALRTVALVNQVVTKMGVDPTPLTGRLQGELKAAAASAGAEIQSGIVGPLRKFLDGDPDHWLAGALAKKDQPAAQPKPAPAAGPDPITNPNEQAQVINAVGKSLIANNVTEALKTIDTHLTRAVGDFRADLLSQRGGANSMNQDHAQAASDFAEAAQLKPDDPVHHANLAEASELVGNVDAAIGAARQALDLNPTGQIRQTAEGVLRRLVTGA